VLPALGKVREASLRAKSMNNLRQIMLAVHQYSSSQGQSLPTIVDVRKPNYQDHPPFAAILPFVENRPDIFLSPADPSLMYVNPEKPFLYSEGSYSSYAYNAIAFSGHAQFPGSIPDGISCTIGIGEHYARCAQHQWVVFIFSLRDSSGDGGARRPS